jgi:hypothetical protein
MRAGATAGSAGLQHPSAQVAHRRPRTGMGDQRRQRHLGVGGVANRVGSIDPGKDATLFIADGDILDTPTQVVQAWIQGRSVDLSSKHTDLYEKYKTKYEQLQPK